MLHMLSLDASGLHCFKEDPHILLCHPRSRKNGKAERLRNTQKPKEQVLGADVEALHILRLLLRDLQSELGIGSEPIEGMHTRGGRWRTITLRSEVITVYQLS